MTQMAATMNLMQAQLKILSSSLTKQKRTKSMYYCWVCGSNYTHVSKTFSARKAGHKEEDHYKKRLEGRKKGPK